MKKIESIIRPHFLEAVKSALREAGVTGMTVTAVKGFGRQNGHPEMCRGSDYVIGLLPKVKIEAVVPDSLVDQAVDAVLKTAKTGRFGDGKVFVTHLDQAIRIRTAEQGESAVG